MKRIPLLPSTLLGTGFLLLLVVLLLQDSPFSLNTNNNKDDDRPNSPTYQTNNYFLRSLLSTEEEVIPEWKVGNQQLSEVLSASIYSLINTGRYYLYPPISFNSLHLFDCPYYLAFALLTRETSLTTSPMLSCLPQKVEGDLPEVVWFK